MLRVMWFNNCYGCRRGHSVVLHFPSLLGILDTVAVVIMIVAVLIMIDAVQITIVGMTIRGEEITTIVVVQTITAATLIRETAMSAEVRATLLREVMTREEEILIMSTTDEIIDGTKMRETAESRSQRIAKKAIQRDQEKAPGHLR